MENYQDFGFSDCSVTAAGSSGPARLSEWWDVNTGIRPPTLITRQRDNYTGLALTQFCSSLDGDLWNTVLAKFTLT